jgi:hypothetical protein
MTTMSIPPIDQRTGWVPGDDIVHHSRHRVMIARRAGETDTDINTISEIERFGWNRLSGATTRGIRARHPNALPVCAVYDLADLRCPGKPFSTHGEDYGGAVQHARDRGRAVAIEVRSDGTLEGLYVGPGLTANCLQDAARFAPADTWRIVAALLEMLTMRQEGFRLSPEQAARLREGHDQERPVYLLYRWQDLRRPIQVYPEIALENAERRALRYDHLLVSLEPDGRMFGIESSPGPEVSFCMVLEEAERTSGGEADADALAVLGAILWVWQDETAYELTKNNSAGDITRADVPEGDLLVEVRRKFCAAWSRVAEQRQAMSANGSSSAS